MAKPCTPHLIRQALQFFELLACNVGVTLVPDGENRWTWRAEGDNHGMTKKISDKWYYFEAWL